MANALLSHEWGSTSSALDPPAGHKKKRSVTAYTGSKPALETPCPLKGTYTGRGAAASR